MVAQPGTGKLFITVVTLFFLYRDGDLLVRQIQHVGRRFFDDRLDHSVRAAGIMTRAVVYGLLVIALAQGVIAGIGYWIFGLEAPALLGAVMALLSMVPLLGTALVWLPSPVGLIVADIPGRSPATRVGHSAGSSNGQRAAASAHQQRHPRAVSPRYVRRARGSDRIRTRRRLRRARRTWSCECSLARLGGGRGLEREPADSGRHT